MQTKINRHGRAGRGFGRRRPFSHAKSRQKRCDRTSFQGFPRNQRGQGRSRKLPAFDPSQFINTNHDNIVVGPYESKNRFSTLGLSDKLVRAIALLGLERPSPIQDQIIPHILENRDVIGLAETGTGKTAAFLIPLINKTLRSSDRQTLVLTPTRELAIQIQDELKKLSQGSNIYSVVCIGGTNIRPQIQALRKKNHFVIGTPGRILDLINQRRFYPEKITTVVLDEADRMLDMGFINDVRKILGNVPKERETLLFSATLSDSTKKVVNDFLDNPVLVSAKKQDVISSIKQGVVHYTNINKFETLTSLLNNSDFKRVIIFGAMKHGVEKLSKQLSRHGIKSESIHGNKSYGQRQRSLKAFKSGDARVLVATDVASRGIHVDDISHVINYDLPNTFEDYVHRIGRTGRVDKRGVALTFVPARS